MAVAAEYEEGTGLKIKTKPKLWSDCRVTVETIEPFETVETLTGDVV